MVTKESIISIMDQLSEIELKGTSKSDYFIDGNRVPRVTEVLSAMIHNDGLMNWSNSLGWKRISYSAFMRDAADKGTYSHLAVETYIKQGNLDINDLNIPSESMKDTVISCMDGFIAWWRKIHKDYKSIEVVYLEETLIHKYFGGTCDCLLKVDGKYWLIDFKTSNHMNYNYALQLSAYKFLLKELKDIDIDKAMILRLDKLNHCYYTYELNMDNEDHKIFIDSCLETFMVLVAAFRMRMITTDQYNKIFNKNV